MTAFLIVFSVIGLVEAVLAAYHFVKWRRRAQWQTASEVRFQETLSPTVRRPSPPGSVFNDCVPDDHAVAYAATQSVDESSRDFQMGYKEGLLGEPVHQSSTEYLVGHREGRSRRHRLGLLH